MVVQNLFQQLTLFETYLLKPVTTLLGQHVYSSFRVSHLHSGAIPHRWFTG